VLGRCFDLSTKFFIDSGAEINVVNHEFIKILINKQYPVKFFPTASRIQCANGSKMSVLGEAILSFDIGGVRTTQKFTVVNDLFPKIIIGIRTMKTMGIQIDTSSDCIYMGNNVQVPFISRVTPDSRVDFESKYSENGPWTH
jgi:predicted aspartyl protease